MQVFFIDSRYQKPTKGSATPLEWTDGRARVLSLQTMGGRRRSARLLDDDRGGADPRSLRGSSRRVGTVARNGHRLRRSADIRLSQLDHVLAQVLLFFRPASEELPGGLRLPRAGAQGAADPAGRSHLKDQACTPAAHYSS